jgi:hypothetical protein
MSGAVHELLARARNSFDTAYLEWRAEYDSPLLARAMQRTIPNFEQRVREGSVAIFEAGPSTGASSAGGRERRLRLDWRAWWRKPSAWRDDLTWEDGSTAVSVANGPVTMMYVPHNRTFYTNQPSGGQRSWLGRWLRPPVPQLASLEDRLRETVLLDPAFLASGWDLTAVGERRHAERAATRIRARWIGDGRLAPERQPFLGVDEYEILVDRERGVLLRYAGLVDGEEAGVYSVRTARFDQPIPDEIFSYQPPAGTKVVAP